jgi:hypothetical protein
MLGDVASLNMSRVRGDKGCATLFLGKTMAVEAIVAIVEYSGKAHFEWVGQRGLNVLA